MWAQASLALPVAVMDYMRRYERLERHKASTACASHELQPPHMSLRAACCLFVPCVLQAQVDDALRLIQSVLDTLADKVAEQGAAKMVGGVWVAVALWGPEARPEARP